MFDHLCLRRWPFVVVPEPSLCNFMADREQFRADLEKLLRSLSRQNASSIHPIWSWFGAGKTHTLYYLSNRPRRTLRFARHQKPHVWSKTCTRLRPISLALLRF